MEPLEQKLSIEEIQSVIESLTLIGNKNISAFGLRVLSRYKKEKGMQTKRIPIKRL